MLLIELDSYRERERDLNAFKYALLTANPDRFGPQLFEEMRQSPIVRGEDVSDLLDDEGNLDFANKTLKYEQVTDPDEIQRVLAEMMGDQTILLTPEETKAVLAEDGWR